MKIRPSLRIYVLVAVLLAGVTTTLVLSALSVNYFFSGLDLAMRRTLISESVHAEVSDGEPIIKSLPGEVEFSEDIVIVATQWQDLPQQLQAYFTPEDLIENQLSKKIIGDSLLLFRPPSEGYFLTKVMVKGELRYAGLMFRSAQPMKVGGVSHLLTIFLTGIGAIVFYILVLWIVMRSVASPVEKLKHWAKDIDENKLKQSAPDFKYSELNTLAAIIKQSLESVQESAEREKRFLGFASHELRTPIAVSRTNSELLRKLIQKHAEPERQLEVLERIERAGLTMTDLTETLLWLNREEEKSLPEHRFVFGHLVEQINDELSYLLVNKKVEIESRTDDLEICLPETLCRIVITNLIRNAIQHTNEGRVEICQRGRELVISNYDHMPDKDIELGFGLGLELIKRLISKYNWHYTSRDLEGGREVTVVFRN